MKTAALPTEKSDAETAAIPDSLLGIIRPVIGRMRGAVTATGSYFIPLQETTQITIDCSQIPVVELDDGTTVLLDYGDRLSENLKGLIRQSGKNYAFLTAEEFRDGLGGLPGIIGHSRNYRMIRTDKPAGVDGEAGNPRLPRLDHQRQRDGRRRNLPSGALPARSRRTAPSRRGKGIHREKRCRRNGDRRRPRGLFTGIAAGTADRPLRIYEA